MINNHLLVNADEDTINNLDTGENIDKIIITNANSFNGLNHFDKFKERTEVYAFGHIIDTMIEKLDDKPSMYFDFRVLPPLIGKNDFGEHTIEVMPVHYTMEVGLDPTMAFILDDELFFCPNINEEFWNSEKADYLKEKMRDSKLMLLDESIKKPFLKIAYYMEELPEEIDMDFLKNIYLNEISLLGEGEGIMLEHIPERMLSSFDNKWRPFVCHHHIKNGKVHTDIRLNVGDHLEGFLLFTPSALGSLDLFNNAAKKVRGVLKGPQSLEWENYEGITELNEIFYIIGKGKYKLLKKDKDRLILRFKSDEGDINNKIINKAKIKNLNTLDVLSNKLRKIEGDFSVYLEELLPNKYFIFFDKLEKESSKRRVSNEQLQNIYNLTIAGKNRPKIAEEVGLSLDTVWRYQKSLGL